MASDLVWLQHALTLAKRAATQNEVPVGAVVVLNQQIIAEGWNQSISSLDPTAHAEIVALRAAAQRLGNYRLLDTTLYVTLEPCIMCVGAMVQARVKRLVYGALDPKVGAVTSAFSLLHENKLNHRIDCFGGLLQEECGHILRDFFAMRRG